MELQVRDEVLIVSSIFTLRNSLIIFNENCAYRIPRNECFIEPNWPYLWRNQIFAKLRHLNSEK